MADEKADAKASEPKNDSKTSSDARVNPQDNPISEAAAAANRTPTEKAIAAQKRMEKTPIKISGRAGGPFSIDGDGFGSTQGKVSVGGSTLTITRWSDTSIKGTLPDDVDDGDIVVKPASGPEYRGTYKRTS